MRFNRLLIAALLAAGCCGAALAQSDTIKKVTDSGKITLAYRESSIPFSYLAGPGKPIGFSVDIAQAVVQEMKQRTNKVLEIEYIPVTSANRIPLVANGTVDLECGSTTNNSTRAKDVTFAHNIFYTGTRLLAKKSSKVRNYADLANKPMSTTSGTTNLQVMRKYSAEKNLNIQVVAAKDHADAMLLVEVDRAVAFAMDDVLLYGLRANAKNPAEWEVVGDALQVEPYACMLRKDDPKFEALVDGVIAKMMKNGEFEKAYKRWFQSPIPPKNINLELPMNEQLRAQIKAPNNKPAL